MHREIRAHSLPYGKALRGLSRVEGTDLRRRCITPPIDMLIINKIFCNNKYNIVYSYHSDSGDIIGSKISH